MKHIFDLQDVTYKVHDSDKHLVDRVSFCLLPGTLTMIIGPNGGGKSTLLKMMAGLLRPTSGTIRLAGKPPQSADVRMSYVPQHFRVSRTVPLTVQDFLKLGRSRCLGGVLDEEIHIALHRWGVCHTQNRELNALSGGERQRVLMARAVLHRPDVLLMDEPAQGLDVLALNDFYQSLEALPPTLTRVIVSHDLDWVMKTADYVICLHHHICCSGKPGELSNTSHPLLAAYVHRHDHTHSGYCEAVPAHC